MKGRKSALHQNGAFSGAGFRGKGRGFLVGRWAVFFWGWTGTRYPLPWQTGGGRRVFPTTGGPGLGWLLALAADWLGGGCEEGRRAGARSHGAGDRWPRRGSQCGKG